MLHTIKEIKINFKNHVKFVAQKTLKVWTPNLTPIVGPKSRSYGPCRDVQTVALNMACNVT
jgi:hypothetical protein